VRIFRKSFVFGLVAIVLLFFGFLIGQVSPPEKASLPPTPIIGPSLSPPSPVESPTPKLKENTFRVIRVIDGDTIEIEGGVKVRLIGIDAPETVHPEKPVECFGREASTKNRELIEGREVRLEKDVSETDKYGRLLRYVYVNGLFVNEYLVRNGYAHAVTYPPDVKYQEQLRQAEQEAREERKGLWAQGVCVALTPEAKSVTTTGCVIKGNISYTTGEKIYHLPECPSYEKTSINEEKGERWFCTEDEAITAGWRKAKNCP